MLLQHSALYILARGIPGIFNFLAIIVYTRLLNPDVYGQYALVIASIGLVESVLFRWLSLSLVRFLPAHTDSPRVLLSALFLGFLGMVIFTGLLGIIAYFVWPIPSYHNLIALSVVLTWTYAWFELNVEMARSRLEPVRYGMMSTLKSGLALIIGSILILLGFGVVGPLIGMMVGTTFSALIFAWREWRAINIKLLDYNLFISLLRYGLPLSATIALNFIVNSSDRFMLAWYLGTDAAGLYSPSYDLAQQSLGVIMLIVNLAAYPLAVNALEKNGEEAARQQLRKNGLLLMAVAFPAATGMAICSFNISSVVLGEAFRETAYILIPWIALATLFSGFKSYYLDLSFHLGRRTTIQLWVMVITALANVAFNIWFIPALGIMGAAYATVIAYAVGFLLSWFLGRKAFRLPAIPIESVKIIIATFIMATALWFTLDYEGGIALLSQVVLGLCVYIMGILALNVSGSREKVIQTLKKKAYKNID